MSLALQVGLCQNLTQTVRGTVLDVDNNLPLVGVNVMLAETDPLIGTTTDIDGTFRLEGVPTRRITLVLSYLGYESRTVPNIVVNAGKEVVLDLQMQESLVEMDVVEVTAQQNKGEALNEMAMISAQSISPEQTNRYAGGFNDPSRIISNFAGVTATQDGSNDIIIRGNSPKYIQWRLEGIQITNPNHFADQSSASGSISALNNNLLAASDFYTGAFTAEYGDVLSGVYDVRLRSGNNEKFESVLGIGLLGTDLTFEGPFKKGYGGSFIVNYRYSTIALIDQLGLTGDIGGIPKFQDAAFKVILPTKKFGTFSLFGLGGYSALEFEDVTPETFDLPGDRALLTEITEDFDKKAHLANTGLTHSLPIGKNSYLKTTVAFSSEGIQDDIYETKLVRDEFDEFIRDSTGSRKLNYASDITKTTYRAATTYHIKLNARNKFQIGAKYALFDFDNRQGILQNDADQLFPVIDFNEKVSTLRGFINWKHRLNEAVSFVAGIHSMNALDNNKSTIEPRFAINWTMENRLTLSAGYGKHSNMESIHHYFTRIEQPDGSLIEPNQNLDLLKAHHVVVGAEKRFGKYFRAKLEAYYQYLYDLPVENDPNSFFATINEGLDLRFVDLVNEGKGENYGIELTIEKFFSNNYYFLVNGSLFESKYTALDGVERNTPFNSQYLFNVLVGKEFPQLGRKRNKTIGLNAKGFYGGGRKVIPLLRDDDGNLAVNQDAGQFWDFSKAYEGDIEDAYTIILSVSYKWQKPKATHELFVNLDNITNHQGKIMEYYDESEPGSIGYLAQFGFFPNLLYRVYF